MTTSTEPTKLLLSRRARVVVLVPDSAAGKSRVAAALEASPSFEVHVGRTPAQALRLVSSRRPEAIVIDDDDDVDPGPREEARLGKHPALGSRALTNAMLVERLVLVIGAARAAREAQEAIETRRHALSVGGMAQWRFDAEARSFAWLGTPGVPFTALTGEGTVQGRLLDHVHPGDRARVERAVVGRSMGPLEYRLVLEGRECTVLQEATTVEDASTGREVVLGTLKDVTELRNAARELDRLTYYDELTSLPNRAHVSRFLAAALSGGRERELAILSVGIEGLGTVDATFGRKVRDGVIREVAKRLREVLEDGESDHRLTKRMAARHGAEELVVVLADAGEAHAAEIFAALRERVAASFVVEGARLVVSCVAGVMLAVPGTSPSVETLLAHADAAMHIARAEGRGAYRLWSSEMQQKLARRQAVEAKLREALREALSGRSGLELHYQPKVNARRGTVESVEALLRWAPDGFGPIGPLEIISVAEQSGLIDELGRFILRTACMQAKRWSVEHRGPLRVAVNVPAQQLASADFADHVTAVLAETLLAPELLELEITEGAMMADAEAARGMLARLDRLGVRVALDDFGTGYSSLSYLTRFPIDCLKIDRSFVVEIGCSAKGEAILRAIVALAESLELEIVAEGVETFAQHAFLAELGDLEIQGWFYSKALPAPALLAWLAAREDREVRATA